MIDLDAAVAELVCLNRQVVYREACPHRPAHESVGEILVRNYARTSPPDVQKRMLAACAPRGSVRI